jgi:formaldehyde-activating enzyme involved in methanogenesis
MASETKAEVPSLTNVSINTSCKTKMAIYRHTYGALIKNVKSVMVRLTGLLVTITSLGKLSRYG